MNQMARYENSHRPTWAVGRSQLGSFADRQLCDVGRPKSGPSPNGPEAVQSPPRIELSCIAVPAQVGRG